MANILAAPGRDMYRMSHVAESLGWTTRDARRLLCKREAAFLVGSRWYTTKALIRERLPECAATIIAGLPE